MSFFGAPATTTAAAAAPAGGFSFGTAAAAPAAAANPSTGFAFSTPAAASTAATGGLGFGSTTITPVQTSTAATGGFGLARPAFGAPAASTATALPAFGAAASTAAGAGGFSLAKPTATAAPMTNFGAPAATASTAASTGFSLSLPGAATTSASTTGFGFGAASAAATTTTTSALSFGAPAAATTSAPAFGGFAAPAATTTAGAAAPAFGALGGAATATAATTSTGFGAATTTAAAPFTGLGGTAASTSAVVGLGGTVTSSSSAHAPSASAASNAPTKPRETALPKPLMDTVDAFKKHVKEEKTVASDIAHTSAKMHQKIQEDTSTLGSVVRQLSSSVTRSKSQLDRLKSDCARELLHAEIAMRTKDTPPAMQYENTAPLEYFAGKVHDFEAQMAHYRRQIEETERSLQALAQPGGPGGRLSGPEDITRAMAKLQATFTNLAGTYHQVHEGVQKQKEIFLANNRQYGDDIFEKNNPQPKKKPAASKSGNPLVYPYPSKVPRDYVGPSPFGGPLDPLTQARINLSSATAAAGGQQQQQQPFQQSFATPSAFGPGSSLLSQTTFQQPQQPAVSQPGLLGTSMSPFGGGLGGGGALGTSAPAWGGAANTTTSAFGTTGGFGATGGFGQTQFQLGGKRGKAT